MTLRFGWAPVVLDDGHGDRTCGRNEPGAGDAAGDSREAAERIPGGRKRPSVVRDARGQAGLQGDHRPHRPGAVGAEREEPRPRGRRAVLGRFSRPGDGDPPGVGRLHPRDLQLSVRRAWRARAPDRLARWLPGNSARRRLVDAATTKKRYSIWSIIVLCCLLLVQIYWFIGTTFRSDLETHRAELDRIAGSLREMAPAVKAAQAMVALKEQQLELFRQRRTAEARKPRARRPASSPPPPISSSSARSSTASRASSHAWPSTTRT